MLYDPARQQAALVEIAPLLSAAGLALVNGESVISQGGAIGSKREARPYRFRAHPLAVDLLSEAGIDVVNVGNNHGGDYGPDAPEEMLDRLRQAGIDYTGGGHDAADAATPTYRVDGDTVVAFVGADLTSARRASAQPTRPGVLHLPGVNSRRTDDVMKGLTAVLRETRQRAHVLLRTPHWGNNWTTEPTRTTKKIAPRLIKAGYDGILGHSAHVVQGVELVDGKPVVYDAGNLLLDHDPDAPDRHGMLYEVAPVPSPASPSSGLVSDRNRDA